jgi:hypothetical protein
MQGKRVIRSDVLQALCEMAGCHVIFRVNLKPGHRRPVAHDPIVVRRA